MSQPDWEVFEDAASRIKQHDKNLYAYNDCPATNAYDYLIKTANKLRDEEMRQVARELAAGGSVVELRRRALAAIERTNNGPAD